MPRPYLKHSASYKPLVAPAQLAYFATLFVTVLLVSAPLLSLIYGSFRTGDLSGGRWTIDNWLDLVNSDIGRTILNTIAVDFLAAGFATVLGFLLSWIENRTDFANRLLLSSLILVSFALPGFILAMSWIILGSPGGVLNFIIRSLFGSTARGFDIYSSGGLILVLSLHLIPVSYLSLRGPLTFMDASLEEAAFSCGARAPDVLTRIVLPLLVYPLGSSFLICFVLAVEQFAIPAMIGIPSHFNVLASQLYLLVNFQPPQRGLAASLGLVLSALTALTLLAHNRIARRVNATTLTGKGFRALRYNLGWMRIPAALFCFIIALFTGIIPILALIYTSLTKFSVSNPFRAAYTFRAFVNLYHDPEVSGLFLNTLIVCLGGAVLTLVIGGAIAYLTTRSRPSHAGLLQIVAAIPFGVPGIVIGLGFLWAYIYLPIYGTLLALILAYSARYLPYAAETVTASLRQIDSTLEEAADMSGASSAQKFRRIVVPLLGPGIQSASLLLFITFFREISAAALLYTPGTQVVSISIWASFENGDWAQASALSLVSLAVIMSALALSYRKGVASLTSSEFN